MNNNAYNEHNIEWLSASMINLYIADPAMAMMKLAGFKGYAGASAWRGIGVDKALTTAIQISDIELDSVISLGKKEMSQHNPTPLMDGYSEKYIKEEKILERCITKAFDGFIQKYRQKDLIASQGKITVDIEDIPIPFIGYYDWLFDDCVVDLKSKGQKTSKADEGVHRQLAIYSKATGKPPIVAYVSPNDITEIEIHDVEKHLDNIRTASFNLERILSYSSDIEECCRLLYPNFDHWMWGESEITQAKKIWRIK
tara:strand:- start:877 stop:1641 length:765 start_codon:yes stop_codon:yes gene_type:complete